MLGTRSRWVTTVKSQLLAPQRESADSHWTVGWRDQQLAWTWWQEEKSALQHKLNSDTPFIQLISQSLHCLFFPHIILLIILCFSCCLPASIQGPGIWLRLIEESLMVTEPHLRNSLGIPVTAELEAGMTIIPADEGCARRPHHHLK
jgi:hypothetical protein